MEERLEGLSVTKPKGLKAGASLSFSLSWLLFVAFDIINFPLLLLLLEIILVFVPVLMLLVGIEAGGRGESRDHVAIIGFALGTCVK
jgi:hypothetical protein